MATYRGVRTETGCRVTVDDRPLKPRLDLRNHSPSGLEWGYLGSGPAQLALALLAHALGDEDALAVYQEFKREMVAPLDEDEWTMTSEQIAAWWHGGGAELAGRKKERRT